MKRKNFNMRLPKDLEDKIMYLKENKGTRISFLVVTAMREYFDRNPSLFGAETASDSGKSDTA